MSTFKQKNKKVEKKRDPNSNSTLDKKHNEMINNFDNKHKNLNKLKIKLNKLNKDLIKLENKDYKEYTPIDVENKAKIKDSIKKIEQDIIMTNSNQSEIEYFNTAIDYIIPYYELIDNKHTIKNDKKVLEINEFFKKNDDNQSNEDKINRAEIFDDYLKATENASIKKRRKRIMIKLCPNIECEGNELTLHLSDGYLICTQCGHSEEILLDSDKPNYKDPIYDNTAYAYKRLNHLTFNVEVITASCLAIRDIIAKENSAISWFNQGIELVSC